MTYAVDRPRNEEGKFVEFSKLGDKTFGLKLFKEDQEKLLKISANRGLSPTEVARLAVHEWLKLK